jgi:hypothetical protein
MFGPNETVASFRQVDVRVLDDSPRDLRHLELPTSNAGPAGRIATPAQLLTAVCSWPIQLAYYGSVSAQFRERVAQHLDGSLKLNLTKLGVSL